MISQLLPVSSRRSGWYNKNEKYNSLVKISREGKKYEPRQTYPPFFLDFSMVF